MEIVDTCRHFNVAWVSAQECYCQRCGRRGAWVGFMVWGKRNAVRTRGNSTASPVPWLDRESALDGPRRPQR